MLAASASRAEPGLLAGGVADMGAPGGALALRPGFGQCQMREQPVRRGAVPMHCIRRDIDRIARVQHLRLLALEADAADPGATEERLSDRDGSATRCARPA
jgi:hypothetical protein